MEKIFTMGQYEEIIEKISTSVEYYNKVYQNGNIYTLYLANGDKIRYSIDKNKIAHLLGVNLDYLVNCGILRKGNSKELLDKFIRDGFSMYSKFNSQILNFSNFFSYHIEDKLDVFKEQLKIPYPNNIYFICKYDKTKNYDTGEIDGYTADYYIVRKLRNEDLILLGLVKNDNNNNYSVQTSRVIKKSPEQLEELTKFLSKQEVTYATNLYLENYDREISTQQNLFLDEKREYLETIVNICKKTGAKPNTTKAHLYDINGYVNIKNKINNKKLILSQLTDALNQNNVFAISDILLDEDLSSSLDEETKELVKKCNDLICSFNPDSSNSNQSYSKLEEEKIKLEEQNKDYDEKIKKLEEENKKLQQQREELLQYKQAYEEFTSKIYELTEKEKNREIK